MATRKRFHRKNDTADKWQVKGVKQQEAGRNRLYVVLNTIRNSMQVTSRVANESMRNNLATVFCVNSAGEL